MPAGSCLIDSLRLHEHVSPAHSNTLHAVAGCAGDERYESELDAGLFYVFGDKVMPHGALRMP